MGTNYDFRVYKDPKELYEEIEKLNKKNNRSRMVAGYCWDWVKEGKANSDFHDIQIPEYQFSKSWNLNNSDTWAIDEESVNEIGCIHTCQGLEFDYVGVIIGEDLICRDGGVLTDHTKRAKTDNSLRGLKKMLKENQEEAEKLADEIIRNTYRTLMTRGQKGCFIYCTDKELEEYLVKRIKEVQHNYEENEFFRDLSRVAEEGEGYN